MKIFNLIGIAATIWAGYILVTSDSIDEGINNIKKSLYDPIDRSREIITIPTATTVITKIDKTVEPVVATINENLSALPVDEAVNTQKVIDNADWGNDVIPTTADVFTQKARAQNSDWSTNVINAGWSASAII